jgi:hypothetical protein
LEYHTKVATGPVTLNEELFAVGTPVLPLPVAVAVKVRFSPNTELHPEKVNIPPEEAGVHVSVAPPVTATEIDPA